MDKENDENADSENKNALPPKSSRKGTFFSDRQTDISFSDRISQLPISRIKKMLKNADPEWKGGTADAILMLVIAAENFCRDLGEKSFDHVQSSGMYYVVSEVYCTL